MRDQEGDPYSVVVLDICGGPALLVEQHLFQPRSKCDDHWLIVLI
jgi:hypothetical protein